MKYIKESDNYKNQKRKITAGKFDRDKQIIFSNEIFEKLGLKSNFSRIDLSEHPFTTTLGLHDVRITTNVRDDVLLINKWI